MESDHAVSQLATRLPSNELQMATVNSHDSRRLDSLFGEIVLPDSQDPSQWTIKQVANYMDQLEVPHDVISKLEVHDINGAVLMHLQFEDLKELDITSFGKRHQLWSAVQALRGGERGPSPVPTPFQDIARPCSNLRSKSDGDVSYSPCSDNPDSPDDTPVSCSGHRKRRHHKKHRRHRDSPIEPGESVSIVAIEQVIPKPHHCSKGEACTTWQKRERLLNAIRKEQSMGGTGWPESASRAGHILITGKPGNPATTDDIVRFDHHRQEQRPVSEVVPSVVGPSVIASSDLLGPGQLPEFALQEATLQQLGRRDPQENVKQFLNFQHVSTGHVEEPPSPPLEMFPMDHHQAFHANFLHGNALQRPGTTPSIRRPSENTSAHAGLKGLPKLTIPRSATANPEKADRGNVMTPTKAVQSPRHNVTTSPASYFRSPSVPNVPISYISRPDSALDAPLTAVPVGPIARDNSQSVPPDMHYRDPVKLQRSGSRAEWRRPSYTMPKLDEEQVFSTVTTVPPTTFPVAFKAKETKTEKANRLFAEFGTDVAHAGWMKKRKTRLLRHDWQDAHFRLHGTVLDMHENARLSAAILDRIDVDEYSVTVSSMPSNSKISSALKTLKISGDKRKDDGSAFAFQLTPGEKDRAKFASGKTHHFAVKSSHERIEWMRELMLAKAKKQKDEGYVVEHNGEKA